MASRSTCSSSSTLSKAVSISDLPYFMDDAKGERRGVDAQHYTLQDMAQALGVGDISSKIEQKGCKNLNDQVAKACITAICNSVNPNFVVDADMEVFGMKDLPDLCTTPKERQDIVVYADWSKTKIVFTAEVLSSPMLWTERKVIIGAANILRLLRCNQDTIHEITTFGLPNMERKQCIVEIHVTWTNFKFLSKITRHTVIGRGISRMREVMEEQSERLPSLPTTSVSRFLIKLSKYECQQICGSLGYANGVLETLDDHFFRENVQNPLCVFRKRIRIMVPGEN